MSESNGTNGINGHALAHVVDDEMGNLGGGVGADIEARQQIEEFVSREMARGPVHKFVLVQIHHQGDARVGEWDSLGGKDPVEVAGEIFDRAKDDARSQLGPLRYAVAVYRAEGKPHAGRKFFNITGGQSEFSDTFDMQRQPPTNAGVLGQLMEHEHLNHALNHKLVQYVIGVLQTRIRDLERQVERFVGVHVRTLETHERLLSEQHRRDLELRKVRFDEVKQEKLFEQIMVLAPLIFRYAVGDKSAVLQLAGLESQLHNLFGSLTQEQLAQIMRQFSPAQIASFTQLAQSLAQSRPRTVNEEVKRKEDGENRTVAPPGPASSSPT